MAILPLTINFALGSAFKNFVFQGSRARSYVEDLALRYMHRPLIPPHSHFATLFALGCAFKNFVFQGSRARSYVEDLALRYMHRSLFPPHSHSAFAHIIPNWSEPVYTKFSQKEKDSKVSLEVFVL